MWNYFGVVGGSTGLACGCLGKGSIDQGFLRRSHYGRFHGLVPTFVPMDGRGGLDFGTTTVTFEYGMAQFVLVVWELDRDGYCSCVLAGCLGLG